MAGIYYGSGGSTTSILVNTPGEAASIVTCYDGHQMARQGRAGAALAIAAIGSFAAGTFGVIVMTLVATPLARAALVFGPAEYFSLMVLGLVLVSCLTSGSIVNALLTASLGIILGTMGIDTMSGLPRFTFDQPELIEGIDVITLVVGLFGVSEVLLNIERAGIRGSIQKHIGSMMLTREDLKRSSGPIARGSVLGFLLGLLPGGGVLASFASYAVEKQLSPRRAEFGKGAIEGVAGPEAANNSGATAAFIPLLTLGIPTNVVLSILLGALMIQGISPGPLLMVDHPELFWGVIASMYIGNIMLLALNLPLVGMWARLLRVPYNILFPLILLFCFIGVYGTTSSSFEMMLMLGFGVLGYFLRKTDYDMAPLVLGFVLGPLMEVHMRRGLIASDGDWSFFISRPISAAGLAFALIILILCVVPSVKNWRTKNLVED